MEFFNSAVDTLQTIVVGLGGAALRMGAVSIFWRGYGGPTTQQAMLMCGKVNKRFR